MPTLTGRGIIWSPFFSPSLEPPVDATVASAVMTSSMLSFSMASIAVTIFVVLAGYLRESASFSNRTSPLRRSISIADSALSVGRSVRADAGAAQSPRITHSVSISEISLFMAFLN